MFTREIRETTFSNNIADELFSRINGDTFRSDVSFLSTIRALIHNRMGDDEGVRLSLRETCVKIDEIKGAGRSKKAKMEALFTKEFDLCTATGQLLIYSLTDTDSENNSAIMELVRESFSTAFGDDYKCAEDLSVFMKRLAEVDFYINKNLKTTVILVNNLDMKTFHMLQAMIPRIFPWYFLDKEPAAPVDEEEKKLLCALGTKNSADYMTVIEILAKRFDFREAKIKKLLNGFEDLANKRELERITEKIRMIERDLAGLNERYSSALKQRRDCQTIELGVRQRMAEKRESEVMEYFMCNKKLHLDEVYGSTLKFVVETYLDEYDPDMFEKNIDNPRSVFYNHTNERFNDDNIKKFLSAIFGDNPVLKIRTCAAYYIELEEFRAGGLSDYDFSTMFNDRLPNQHIQRHSCLGNNERYISDCLEKGDYILAIEQCVFSARNINMADSIVVDEFMERIFAPNAKRFVELPNGELCTPYEALQWLEKEEESEEVV